MGKMSVVTRTALAAVLSPFLAMAFAAPLAYAQMRGGGPCMGNSMGKSPCMGNYDPASELTVKGTVQEVKTFTGGRGWTGIHLTLKSGEETLDVHLGPSAFLKQQGFEFAKGDQIEVTGSKVKFGAGEAVIAREVTKGDQTLTLRDTQGIPKWSGGAMAQPGK